MAQDGEARDFNVKGQGIQIGTGNVQHNHFGSASREPLDLASLDRLSPRAAAARVRSLPHEEVVDFFSKTRTHSVTVILAALFDLDQERAVAILADLDRVKARKLLSSVYLRAWVDTLQGVGRLHPLDDFIEPGGSSGKAQLTPDAFMPFRIDKQKLDEQLEELTNFRLLVSRRKCRALKAADAEAVYLPFWVFNATRVTNYTSQRGRMSEESIIWDNKRSRQQTRIFSGLAIPAYKAFDGEYPDVKHHKMRPYRDGCLDRYSVCKPDTGARAAFLLAEKQMNESVSDDCERDIGGDYQRVIKPATTYSQVVRALIYVPSWRLSFTDRDIRYQFTIDGLTGEVIGLPWLGIDGTWPNRWVAYVLLPLFGLFLLLTILAIW